MQQVIRNGHNTDGNNDIPMQKQACHDFAKQQGWQIIKEYQELGISGFKVSAKDRDVMQDIQKATAEGKFDILLVYMFDRIGRREDETPFVVEWFTHQGVEVWSTQEGQQRFDNHVNKLMNYIRYWQASGESIKTSVRTKTSMGQMVQAGHFRGGTRPYGYRLVKKGRINKKGHEVHDLEICPIESEVVKMLFDKYVLGGYGQHRLTTFLVEQGIKNRNGRVFSSSTIRTIIKNPLYIGILTSGETTSEAFQHLQIIDNATFDKAQETRQQRSNDYEPLRRLLLRTKGASLMSGNIFCGSCGGRLNLTTNGKIYTRKDGVTINKKRIRYTCYNKSRKIIPCDGQTGYTMTKLDDIISVLLLGLFQNVKDSPEDALIEQRYQSELAIITSNSKPPKQSINA